MKFAMCPGCKKWRTVLFAGIAGRTRIRQHGTCPGGGTLVKPGQQVRD